MSDNKGLILLVEDNPDEIDLMQIALHKADIRNPVRVLMDGQSALDYLQGKGNFADRDAHPLPCLVFLDIRLPRQAGFSALDFIKKHPTLKRIPVVVLTSSREPADITKAYDLGANSFLTKPTKFAEFVEMVRMSATYWITGNRTVQ